MSGGGLPSPVPGTRAMSATASLSRLLATASGSSSSGTVKSKSGLLALEHRLFPYKRVPHSCDTLIPDAVVRDFDGLRAVRWPTPR